MQNGLTISEVGGFCPCQAYGTMDGNPFYFRARHGDWQLDVSAPGTDPADANIGAIPALYREEGDDTDNGYMSPETASDIIHGVYGRFVVSRVRLSDEVGLLGPLPDSGITNNLFQKVEVMIAAASMAPKQFFPERGKPD